MAPQEVRLEGEADGQAGDRFHARDGQAGDRFRARDGPTAIDFTPATGRLAIDSTPATGGLAMDRSAGFIIANDEQPLRKATVRVYALQYPAPISQAMQSNQAWSN